MKKVNTDLFYYFHRHLVIHSLMLVLPLEQWTPGENGSAVNPPVI